MPSPSRPVLAAVLSLLAVAPAGPGHGDALPLQVTDLPTAATGGSSGADRYVAVGGLLYFTAADPFHGAELWRTDGTEGGTEIVADLCPGRCTAYPHLLTAVGERLFFLARGATEQVALWVVDGPGEPPSLIEHLPIPRGELVADPVAFREAFYFVTTHPETGREVWVSDGTADGTFALDLCTGPCSTYPAELTVFDDLLLFVAGNHNRWDRELWRSDGTLEGTFPVADICPDYCSSDPRALHVAGDRAYFSADDGVHGRELWASDGTAAGTLLLEDFVPGEQDSDPRVLSGPDGRIYVETPGLWEGPRWWRTDGTPGGARAALELIPAGRTRSPSRVLPGPKRLYFVTPGPDGDELWVLDRDGRSSQLLAGPFYNRFSTARGRLFFLVRNWLGLELWASDGTTPGTVRIHDYPPVVDYAAFGRRLVFLTDYPAPEVWRNDGTYDASRRILALEPEGRPRRMVTAGGLAYFLTSSEEGVRLWRSNGTRRGTFPLLLVDGPLRPDPDEMVSLGRSLVFTRFEPTTGEELWISDGTPSGTRMLADIHPGAGSSNPTALTVIGDLIVFAADDGEAGHEPWVTDGTAAGTFRLADVHPGPAPSSPGAFAAAGEWLMFDANDGLTGRELWAVPLAAARARETAGGPAP